MVDPTRVVHVDQETIGVVVAGKPGSGKTYALTQAAKGYLAKNQDPNYRMLCICPKEEGFEELMAKKQKPARSYKDMVDSFSKNTVTVYFPSMDDLETQVDEAIDFVFNTQAANPDLKTVIILDDAQVLISPRSEASPSLKRLTLTGRSRQIRGVFVSHSPVFNKALDGQIDTLWIFGETSPSYDKNFRERYSYDAEAFRPLLMERRYSSVYYDVRDKPILMAPIGE